MLLDSNLNEYCSWMYGAEHWATCCASRQHIARSTRLLRLPQITLIFSLTSGLDQGGRVDQLEATHTTPTSSYYERRVIERHGKRRRSRRQAFLPVVGSIDRQVPQHAGLYKHVEQPRDLECMRQAVIFRNSYPY